MGVKSALFVLMLVLFKSNLECGHGKIFDTIPFWNQIIAHWLWLYWYSSQFKGSINLRNWFQLLQRGQVPGSKSWRFHHYYLSIPICRYVWRLGPWHMLVSCNTVFHIPGEETIQTGYTLLIHVCLAYHSSLVQTLGVCLIFYIIHDANHLWLKMS